MIHRIQTISIPKTLGFKRDLVTPYGRDGLPIPEEDLEGYDRYTIFYDVFYSQKNGSLMAVGPPLLNLRKQIFPMRLVVNGVEVSYEVIDYYPKVFWIVIDYDTAGTESWEILFSFACGLELSVDLVKDPGIGSSALITMQKNNNLRRIEDWIAHFRENYDIDRIFIYDNNSDDFELLSACLTDLDFVPWNFPFGILTSQPNKFAQRGALNHFLYRFTKNTRIFQFDVDELAHMNIPLENGLSYYLKDHLIRLPDNLPEGYSFSDYPTENIDENSLNEYKYSRPKKRHHNKYICQSELVEHLEVHYFTPHVQSARKILLKWAWAGWKRLKTFEGLICLFTRIVSHGRIRFLSYRYGRIDHYQGITTPWRKPKKK